MKALGSRDICKAETSGEDKHKKNKRMKCVVVLLSLLSVGRSAPLSNCDALLQPADISKDEVSDTLLFGLKKHLFMLSDKTKPCEIKIKVRGRSFNREF